MTTTIPTSQEVHELIASLVEEWKDAHVVFKTEGVYTPQGVRLNIPQAQDLFDTNQKIVFAYKGDEQNKIHKLMYGIIQCESYELVISQNNTSGSKSAWYYIKHLSADGIEWFSICRVYHCINGELIVSKFPGRFNN